MWRTIINLKLKAIVLSLCTVVIIIWIPIFLSQYVHHIFSEDSSSIPILIWWTPFMPNFERIIKCDDDKETLKCLVNSKHSLKDYESIDAFLFYGSHIENHDYPIRASGKMNALWAIFHEESPKNYAPILYQDTQELFNITSTFSRNSSFPVTLQYLESLSLLTSELYFIPIDVKNNLLQNLSPVVYIQSDCDTPIGRDFLVKELSKHMKIDSYGKCLKNREFPKELEGVNHLDLFDDKYLHFLAQYKFVISFENAICEDYVTEKLWRPLIVGSIPIYLGSPTIEDWLPNENSAILVKNFADMESLAKFVEVVNKNETLYNSFMEHKIFSRITNDYIEKNLLGKHPVPKFECYVCKNIHEENSKTITKKGNVYDCPKPSARSNENTWDQHWEIGRCQSKALKMLLNQGILYSEEKFESTWRTLHEMREC